MSGETELTTAYSSKVAGDLERNVAEQERIRGEVARLTAELDELMHDHGVLLNLQKALQAGASESDRKVPRQKNGKAGKGGGRHSGAGKVTLVDLIRDHLAASDDPCSASEVTTVLSERHRDRHIQTTVVRTSLENLVAKGRARRIKRGSSVFYTEVTPAP
ncbi:hypothetical protein ACFVU3_32445 [Streptomyces sp. NPDC058052]|uniref:hypothetical protein n=1 Tax=Streptomyces sp. NPDC058052 TaxID=3346316 RepID=UPI0036E7620D